MTPDKAPTKEHIVSTLYETAALFAGLYENHQGDSPIEVLPKVVEITAGLCFRAAQALEASGA